MVSAEVCGRDSFISSITSPSESSLSSELPSDVCFSTDSQLSLSTSLDSDVDRTELAMLPVLTVPTAATTSFGGLNEKDKLSRNPRLGADSGAKFNGFALAKIASDNSGTACGLTCSSSRSSSSLNVFRPTGFPSGPFRIDRCDFLLLAEFMVVVDAEEVELAVFLVAGGSREKTELNSAEASVPFNIRSELVSDPVSPFLELVLLRVRSVQ